MKTFDEALSVVMLPAGPAPVLEQDLINTLNDVKASERAQDYLNAICHCVALECASRGYTVEMLIRNVAVNSFAGGLRVGQEMEKGSNGPSE